MNLDIALISQELAGSLNLQLTEEKINANNYLFIAGALKNRALDNLAKHFEEQHEEETKHALMIYNLLTNLNAKVVIEEMPLIDFEINSVLDIAKIYLQREIFTTQWLNAIKKQAIAENNPIVEEKMRQMLALQEQECKDACDWCNHAELCGEDWHKVFLWNNTTKG
jgi:ferritin